MTASSRPSFGPPLRTRILWALVWVGIALGLGALAWTAGQGVMPEERGGLVRYVGILIAVAWAVGGPHLWFPDPRAARWLLVNPASGRLLRRQVRRGWPVVAALAVVPAVLAVGEGGGVRLAAEGVLAAVAVGLTALARTAPLGLRMRRWASGESGGAYRAIRTVHPPLRFSVPDALVPQLLVTGEVLLLGSAVAVLGQALGGTPWSLAPALALLAVAVAGLVRLAPRYDRAYWTTHGALADAFRQTTDAAGARRSLGVEAVYWVPRALRPSVWGLLASLDRRLPLGRAVAAGLLVVGAVELAGAAASVRTAALALVVAGVNAAGALTASEALVPGAWAARWHGAAAWAAVRFLANVRWLPPILVTVLGLAWLSDRVPWTDALRWGGLFLAGAVLSAVLSTWAVTARLRRRYA